MNLIKSKRRVADHGEVLTPGWLVEKMLDLVKGETGRIDSRFLEPACGSGNFLVPVLQRKWQAALRPGEGLPRYEDVMLGSLGRLADHAPAATSSNG